MQCKINHNLLSWMSAWIRFSAIFKLAYWIILFFLFLCCTLCILYSLFVLLFCSTDEMHLGWILKMSHVCVLLYMDSMHTCVCRFPSAEMCCYLWSVTYFLVVFELSIYSKAQKPYLLLSYFCVIYFGIKFFNGEFVSGLWFSVIIIIGILSKHLRNVGWKGCQNAGQSVQSPARSGTIANTRPDLQWFHLIKSKIPVIIEIP